MVSAASLAIMLRLIKRVVQRKKKQSVDYTSAKIKLIQSWCYKILAVISYKAIKNQFSFIIVC